MSIVLVALLAATLAYSLRESLLFWVRAAGLVVTNYQGKSVPIYGLGYVLALVPCWILANLLWPLEDLLSLSLAILLATLIGFIDDAAGAGDSKGLKGHLLMAINERRITTGLLKVAYVFIAALLLVQSSWPWLILEVLVLTLFSNLINGFDLRPGRANKVFLMLTVPLFVYAYPGLVSLVLLSAIAVVLVYLPLDLGEAAIMGDAGAYVLGLLLGYAVIRSFSTLEVFLVLLVLIYLHWFMEVGSISEVIEKNSALKRMDEWGRLKEDNHNENRL